MRVLIVGFNRVGVGTYQRTSHLAESLGRRGHDVTVMAVAPQERYRIRQSKKAAFALVESPDLFTGSLRSGWDPWDTYQRMRWVSRRSFDVVHAVESRPVVLFPALLAKKRGASLVMDWCDWLGRGGAVEERESALVRALLGPVETWFEEEPKKLARQAIAISEFLAARFRQLGVDPTRISVIHNGCDVSLVPLSTIQARQRVGIPADWPIVGYCGTAYPRDAVLLARAFNEVARRSKGCRLLLVGYFNRSIGKMVELPEMVLETGPLTQAEVHTYLSSCDVFWLPLTDTGANRARWPGKLNDYLAAGRPTVATMVGDGPSLVTQYRAGLASPADPVILANETVKLLTDHERARAMGVAARQAAEGPLSWERTTDAIEMVYRR